MRLKQLIKDNPIGPGRPHKDWQSVASGVNHSVDPRLYKVWRDTAISNLDLAKHSVGELMNALKGETVGIVARGPSLRADIESGALKRFAEKHKIIAVNMAHNDLMDVGITPWATIAMDFVAPPIKTRNTTKLFTCVKTNHEFVRNWYGDRYFFIAGTLDMDFGMPAEITGRWILQHVIKEKNFDFVSMEYSKKPCHIRKNKDQQVITVGKPAGESKELTWPVFTLCYIKHKDDDLIQVAPVVQYIPELPHLSLPQIPMGGNVASGALSLAFNILIAQNVVFIGHDYCMYDESEYGGSDKTFRQVWEFDVSVDNPETMRRTNFNYFKFYNWSEWFMKGAAVDFPDRKFINCSPRGLLGAARHDNGYKRPDYMTYMTLDEFLKGE